MNLRPQRREEPEVNLTPLIDVVFLLLLFFMLSTTFNRESQLSVDLPEASAEPSQAPEQALEITVSQQGDYFIGDQKVVNNDPATLRRALSKVAGKRKDIPVVIRADGLAPHQSVVTVMDVAARLGLVRISLATVKREGSH